MCVAARRMRLAAMRSAPATSRVSDPLAYVINTFQNLGDVKTRGLDLQ